MFGILCVPCALARHAGPFVAFPCVAETKSDGLMLERSSVGYSGECVCLCTAVPSVLFTRTRLRSFRRELQVAASAVCFSFKALREGADERMGNVCQMLCELVGSGRLMVIAFFAR